MFEIFKHNDTEVEEKKLEKLPEHDEILRRNNIQRGFMYHFAEERGHKPDDPKAELDYVEWIQKHAEDFALAYEDIQTNEPEILDNWPDHASVVYEEISKRIEPEAGGQKLAA